MRRLKADEVKLAYQKTGLTPVTGMVLGREVTSDNKIRDVGCAIGACFVAQGLEFPSDGSLTSMKAATALGLTGLYASGFIIGFDNVPDSSFLPTYTEQQRGEYKTGYKDGVAAREALFA